MPELDFNRPQRQSVLGIVLIFSTSLFHIVKNFWVLGVYFFVREIDTQIVIYSVLGFLLLMLITLVYSIFSYLRFQFYLNAEKGEFVLEKGVFSTEVISIAYNKIQQVNLNRNLLQRVLGVYSVSIDTAGSKDKEVEIKALSQVQAEKLADLLLEFAGREKVGSELDAVAEDTANKGETTTTWTYRLSLRTLLKLGLTSNYFRGLAILFAFYFSLKEQLQFSEEVLPMPNVYLMEIANSVVLVLLLILVGMILTLGETFIKYYNLELKRTSAGLQLEMGLRDNKKVSLRAERVQLFQVLTNPLQKKLNLFKLKISLASSRDELQKNKIQIPGIPGDIVELVEQYLYTSEVTENQQIRPHRMLMIRRCFQGLVPLLISLGIWSFTAIPLASEWVAGASLLYVLILALVEVVYYRSLKLSISEDFLVKHSAVWIRRKQILEMYKLQAVSVSKPLWYKKRGLLNLTFHTAGGDVAFPLVSEKEAEPLVNYLLFRIESEPRTWM